MASNHKKIIYNDVNDVGPKCEYDTIQHPTLYDCTVQLYNALHNITVQNPMDVGLFTYDAGLFTSDCLLQDCLLMMQGVMHVGNYIL